MQIGKINFNGMHPSKNVYTMQFHQSYKGVGIQYYNAGADRFDSWSVPELF